MPYTLPFLMGTFCKSAKLGNFHAHVIKIPHKVSEKYKARDISSHEYIRNVQWLSKSFYDNFVPTTLIHSDRCPKSRNQRFFHFKNDSYIASETLMLSNHNISVFKRSRFYREPEKQQNARPFGSSMAEWQRIGCLDARPCNCKQTASLRFPIRC